MPSTVGSPHRHFRSTDSTNERARVLASGGAPSGTVVTATEQTQGRGRYGRVWMAPAGKALLYSAVLREPEAVYPLLSLVAAVATAEAVEAVAPVSAQIKWPNDIWIEERKVAGVLIESRPPQWAVVGIGINASIEREEFPDDLRWPATSVGSGATPERLLRSLNERLGEWLAAPPEHVLASYRPRDALAGRKIEWTGAGGLEPLSGTAGGVDEAGNLTMAGPDGDLTISSGEVAPLSPE
ncbi:MAG: biotin--[acetyl-CoA-carboxylase] ligase [Solirubrobacterales bacterium]